MNYHFYPFYAHSVLIYKEINGSKEIFVKSLSNYVSVLSAIINLVPYKLSSNYDI